jgi:hypothetical protein
MTVKKQTHEPNRVIELSRRVGLAYIGAFGIMGDELYRLFERFVTRGERMEREARKRMKRNTKHVQKMAAEFEHEQKANYARATKAVRKTVKRAEHAIA